VSCGRPSRSRLFRMPEVIDFNRKRATRLTVRVKKAFLL
jgi:hypothetical protein